MKKCEYRSNLSRLPIINPTLEDMAQICPHLSKEHAVSAFSNSGFVACPPLKVRNAFQIVSFSESWRDGRKRFPAKLEWAFTGRLSNSFARGNKPADFKLHKYTYSARAIKFAEKNWGEDLILDYWSSVTGHIIMDPTKLVTKGIFSGWPKVTARVWAAFNWKLIDEHASQYKQASIVRDLGLCEITKDEYIAHELIGQRPVSEECYCAYCAAALSNGICSGCKRRFRDFGNACSFIPLSRKIVKFLQDNGHKFIQDPELAWKVEKHSHDEVIAARHKLGII